MSSPYRPEIHTLVVSKPKKVLITTGRIWIFMTAMLGLWAMLENNWNWKHQEKEIGTTQQPALIHTAKYSMRIDGIYFQKFPYYVTRIINGNSCPKVCCYVLQNYSDLYTCHLCIHRNWKMYCNVMSFFCTSWIYYSPLSVSALWLLVALLLRLQWSYGGIHMSIAVPGVWSASTQVR